MLKSSAIAVQLYIFPDYSESKITKWNKTKSSNVLIGHDFFVIVGYQFSTIQIEAMIEMDPYNWPTVLLVDTIEFDWISIEKFSI